MEADDDATTTAAVGEKMPQQPIKLPAPVANIYRAVRSSKSFIPSESSRPMVIRLVRLVK